MMLRLASRPLVFGLTVAGLVLQFAGAGLLAYNLFAR